MKWTQIWAVWIFLGICCIGKSSHASGEILIMQASAQVRYCPTPCKAQATWKPLPSHWTLSIGDWVDIPQGESFAYRMLAASRPIRRVTGPQRLRLLRIAKPALSGKLLGIWKRILRSLRGQRAQSGTGAVRTGTMARQHPAFVDLVSPRNTRLLRTPSRLQWKAPSQGRYQVRLFSLRKDYTESTITTYTAACQANALCYVSIPSRTLRPGIRYFWQVKRKAQPKRRSFGFYPSYGVYFEILSPAQRKALQDQFQRISRLKLPAHQKALQRVALLIQASCFQRALQSLPKLHSIPSNLRQNLRDEVMCVVCRPWKISPPHAASCSCNDDPGRPIDQ